MKARNFLLAGLAGMILAACTSDIALEDKAEMRGVRSGLKVEVSDEFASASTRADYSGFPATTFETGDAIGLYAFDGTSYVASNIRFVRQSDGSWTPDEDVPYNAGHTYYAYFPYRSTVYTPSTSGTVDAVDTKFASFISDASNYFWKADQSTKANYTYSNLMIAKGTVTAVDADAATVKFTMKHKRGLAIFEGNGLGEHSFTGNVPYPVSASRKLYLMKPNTDTSIGGFTKNAPSGEYLTQYISWNYTGWTLTLSAPAAYTYAGGTNSYSVTSYKTSSGGGSSIPAAWTATYSTDGGTTFSSTKPAWLTTFTNSGYGSTSATSYNSTVAAQTAVIGTASDTYAARTCIVRFTQGTGGQTKDFTITQNAFTDTYTYYLTVTGPANYTYAGGTKSYSVTSYKQNTARTTAVAWTATYSTNSGSSYSGTKPSWITAFTGTAAGGSSASAYNATVAAQTPTSSATQDVYAARSCRVKISQNEGSLNRTFDINQTANTVNYTVPDPVSVGDWTAQ